MIVRDANRRTIDHGPTPGLSHLPVTGSICRPVDRPARPPRPKTDPAIYTRDWKRRKRLSDPAWAQRQRDLDRARYARQKAAAA